MRVSILQYHGLYTLITSVWHMRKVQTYFLVLINFDHKELFLIM